ncbi:threonine-phosphate decarboxylase CobD [Pseudovibrio sp. SPO723]|uniref:threonine-phosphate decarboxylase CobD n=1 Tax=Nesiotobacter zosterae TaxID=392721 RepID=UPI0029C1481B|nr:threonine-phosphate decarboxylase CobD [Pseudovibrio sp. SPO723]MDX5592659.1 threonine-phosphate decarboxylase CobD [Pseudovibrio sp. SPO723]
MRHGGDLSEAIARFGGTEQGWMDLSTGINPHAYPTAGNLAQADWASLPTSKAESDLIAAARRAYEVPSHLVMVAAPGTQALISQLPYLVERTTVAILSPTYAPHEESWASAGHTVMKAPSLEHLPQAARVAVVVNPNNPTGTLYGSEALLATAQQLKARGGLLIVDEAFADCLEKASLLPHLTDLPVVVLRSFGKFYGLAGLRLGFMIGSHPLCDAMKERLGTWAVSGPALKIGTAALGDNIWRREMRTKLVAGAQRLEKLVASCGMVREGGTPLFSLISGVDAEALHAHLAAQHIWTRHFDYSKTWLRLGHPASQTHWQRLETALTSYKP